MNDLRKYSRQFICEFIDLYKSLPAVWKIKSKEYSNRDLKTQAYEVLVEKWKEVEPQADRDFVVKKINSMRTVYRRELKKIGNEYSGMGVDEVPSPSLWYFYLLDFLQDQEVARSSTSSLEQKNTQDTAEEIELSEQISSPGESSITTSASSMPPPSPTPSSASSSTITSSRRPKKRPQNSADNVLAKISNQLDEPLPKLDRFDYMAKAWAETLRSLPNEQRIFAEKIISDVLFEAQLNTLTRESHLQVQNTAAQIHIPNDFNATQLSGSFPESQSVLISNQPFVSDQSQVISYIQNFQP